MRKPRKAAPAKKVQPKRAARKPRGSQRTYTLRDAAVAERLAEYLAARGTTMDALVSMALRVFDVRPDTLTLRSKLTFGKYYGYAVEDVIRNDLSYFLWMSSTVERVRFTPECDELAEQLKEAAEHA